MINMTIIYIYILTVEDLYKSFIKIYKDQPANDNLLLRL